MRFKIICYSICGILIICYLLQQYYLTPDFPFGDDLPTIFVFLLRFDSAQYLSEKLRILYDNHFLEHRLVTSGLITLVIYKLSGTVHLPFFTLVAGLFWVSLLIFYHRYIKKSSLSAGWLLITTCVLLASASYQASYWPMASLQHFLVIFFVVSTINFLCSEQLSNRFFLVAIFTAVLATFTSGNGLAVWPSGLLVLFLRKEFKLLFSWLGTTLLAVLLYFWRFPMTGAPSDKSLQTLFSHSFNKAISFLAGLGSAVRFKGVPYFFDVTDVPFSLRYPAIYVGLFMVFIFLWALRKSIFQRDPTVLFILGSTTFIFISFALIVLGRPSDSANISIFKSRYCPYSLVAICNTIFLVAVFTKSAYWHTWLLRLSIVCGLFFWGGWQLLAYPKIINHNHMLQAGFFNWQHNNAWTIYQITPYYEKFFNVIFDEMKAVNFPYESPDTPLSIAFREKQKISAGFSTITNLTVKERDNKVDISALNKDVKPLNSMSEGYALVMATKKDTFLLWPTVNHTTIRNFLLEGQLCGSGYLIEATLDRKFVPKGVYSLHQFRYANGKGFLNKAVSGSITL